MKEQLEHNLLLKWLILTGLISFSVVAAWSEAVAKGLGSLELEGAMVDIPVVKRAEALLRSVENMEQRELS